MLLDSLSEAVLSFDDDLQLSSLISIKCIDYAFPKNKANLRYLDLVYDEFLSGRYDQIEANLIEFPLRDELTLYIGLNKHRDKKSIALGIAYCAWKNCPDLRSYLESDDEVLTHIEMVNSLNI